MKTLEASKKPSVNAVSEEIVDNLGKLSHCTEKGSTMMPDRRVAIVPLSLKVPNESSGNVCGHKGSDSKLPSRTCTTTENNRLVQVSDHGLCKFMNVSDWPSECKIS